MQVLPAYEATRRRRWRCRRGMKELDVLLTRYLDQRLPAAGARETAAFDRFLELPDPELARYLLAGEPSADPEFHAIAQAARDSRP